MGQPCQLHFYPASYLMAAGVSLSLARGPAYQKSYLILCIAQNSGLVNLTFLPNTSRDIVRRRQRHCGTTRRRRDATCSLLGQRQNCIESPGYFCGAILSEKVSRIRWRSQFLHSTNKKWWKVGFCKTLRFHLFFNLLNFDFRVWKCTFCTKIEALLFCRKFSGEQESKKIPEASPSKCCTKLRFLECVRK